MTKVIDIIQGKSAPFASFELVPPLKGSDINKLYRAMNRSWSSPRRLSTSRFTGMK